MDGDLDLMRVFLVGASLWSYLTFDLAIAAIFFWGSKKDGYLGRRWEYTYALTFAFSAVVSSLTVNLALMFAWVPLGVRVLITAILCVLAYTAMLFAYGYGFFFGDGFYKNLIGRLTFRSSELPYAQRVAVILYEEEQRVRRGKDGRRHIYS